MTRTEEQRALIGNRTREALTELREKRFPAGTAPYGYSSQPRTAEERRGRIRKPLVRNERESACMKRIRRLQKSGKSRAKIAEVINAEGFLTRPSKKFPNGGPWAAGSVDRIIVAMDVRA